MLGLHCCVGFPLVADSRGYSLVVMHSLLTVVALLVAELRLNCSEARGAFLAQGSNLCLLHCQADSLPLSHQGSAKVYFKNINVSESGFILKLMIL